MTRFPTIALACLVGSADVSEALRAASWPQFRGPTGLGYTTEKGLPLTWNAKTGENIRWPSVAGVGAP